MKKALILSSFLLCVSITYAHTQGYSIPVGCYIDKLNFIDLFLLGLVQFLLMFFIQKIAYDGREIGHTRNNIAIVYAVVVCITLLSFSLALLLYSLLMSYITLVLFIIAFAMTIIVFFEEKMQFDEILFIIFNCVGLIIVSMILFNMHFQLLIASVIGIIVGLFSYYFWQWLDNRKKKYSSLKK